MRKEIRYYKDNDCKIKSRVIIHEDVYFERKSKPMKDNDFTYPNFEKEDYIVYNIDGTVFHATKLIHPNSWFKIDIS